MTYDLIILGAGPAGLAASIYSSYHKVSHLVVGEAVGGTALEAAKIKNYPGMKAISGAELMKNFREHAEELGGEIMQASITGLIKKDSVFEVEVADKKYEARTLLLALGTRRRKLNVPGEEKFLGKGVSYCATCDAMFFRNKTVAVIGGGNSAVMAATLLAEHASKVYLIYRGPELKSQPLMADQVKSNPKITIIYNTNVLEIQGQNKVENISLDKPFNGEAFIKTDGVFIEIGAMPSTGLIKQLGVGLDEAGYVIIDQWGKTNVPGVYAAGDMTSITTGFNQVITAAADGATAVNAIYRYLKEIKK